jgi:hypothetical protein
MKLTRGYAGGVPPRSARRKTAECEGLLFAEATWEAGAVPEQNLEHFVY